MVWNVLSSTWLLLALLGCLSSILAWTIDEAVIRMSKLHSIVTGWGYSWVTKYFYYVLFRIFTTLLAVFCTQAVSPQAAGSGIPEMRSILGGFPLPGYLSARAAVAKTVGLIAALGSGLPLGKEGPFVHLSCIIANQLLRIPWFTAIRNSPDLTHHVLSAACAVGVTSTFGAPIGGVLFSIEVTTIYYMTSNYWRAFFCSVMGVVVFRWLNQYSSWDNPVSLFSTSFTALPYKYYEVILFLVLSSLCGALGGAFVHTYATIVKFQRHTLNKRLGRFPALKFAMIVAILFGCIEYPVGSFMVLNNRKVIDDMFSSFNLSGGTGSNETHLGKKHIFFFIFLNNF